MLASVDQELAQARRRQHLHQGQVGDAHPQVQPVQEPDTPGQGRPSGPSRHAGTQLIYKKFGGENSIILVVGLTSVVLATPRRPSYPQRPSYLQKATPKRALMALKSQPPR